MTKYDRVFRWRDDVYFLQSCLARLGLCCKVLAKIVVGHEKLQIWKVEKVMTICSAGRGPTTDSSSWWYGWGPSGNENRQNTLNRWQKQGLDAKEKGIIADSEILQSKSTKLAMTSVFPRPLSDWTRTALRGRVLAVFSWSKMAKDTFEIRLIEWIRAARKQNEATKAAWPVFTTGPFWPIKWPG